jgi:hypothetical protein
MENAEGTNVDFRMKGFLKRNVLWEKSDLFNKISSEKERVPAIVITLEYAT